MTNRLRCPECGCDEFIQDRSVIFDESVIVKYNSKGEVDDEYVEDSECGGEDSAGPYRCRCGWQLIDEDQNPIIEPDDVGDAFETATLVRRKKDGPTKQLP